MAHKLADLCIKLARVKIGKGEWKFRDLREFPLPQPIIAMICPDINLTDAKLQFINFKGLVLDCGDLTFMSLKKKLVTRCIPPNVYARHFVNANAEIQDIKSMTLRKDDQIIKIIVGCTTISFPEGSKSPVLVDVEHLNYNSEPGSKQKFTTTYLQMWSDLVCVANLLKVDLDTVIVSDINVGFNKRPFSILDHHVGPFRSIEEFTDTWEKLKVMNPIDDSDPTISFVLFKVDIDASDGFSFLEFLESNYVNMMPAKMLDAITQIVRRKDRVFRYETLYRHF